MIFKYSFPTHLSRKKSYSHALVKIYSNYLIIKYSFPTKLPRFFLLLSQYSNYLNN